MVDVFREVRRVLRDDGVVWLNYGDCYGHGTEARRPQGNTRGISDKTSDAQNINRHGGTAGNLMMMPHRVALALQADGWIIRQDLVWYKRNPMPESVNGWRWQRERTEAGRTTEGGMQMSNLAAMDAGIKGGKDKVEWEYGDDLELRKGSWRHTRAHEYVFMLVKGMQYWSNQEAVRESIQSGPSDIRKMEQGLDRIGGKNKELIDPLARASATTNLGRKRAVGNPSGRNPRSVLDVPTAPYKGAHYATFPPNLIAPLIRATCPRRCCPVCGQGWAAVVDISDEYRKNLTRPNVRGMPLKKFGAYLKERREEIGISKAEIDRRLGTNTAYAWWEGRNYYGKWTQQPPTWDLYIQLKEVLGLDERFDDYLRRQDGGWQTDDGDIAEIGKSKRGNSISMDSSIHGYRPTCEHPHTQEEAVPGIVFDPFVGSGTTVKVAQDLLRKGIGIDISMEYLDLQAKVRIGQGSPSNVLDDLPLFSNNEPTPPHK